MDPWHVWVASESDVWHPPFRRLPLRPSPARRTTSNTKLPKLRMVKRNDHVRYMVRPHIYIYMYICIYYIYRIWILIVFIGLTTKKPFTMLCFFSDDQDGGHGLSSTYSRAFEMFLEFLNSSGMFFPSPGMVRSIQEAQQILGGSFLVAGICNILGTTVSCFLCLFQGGIQNSRKERSCVQGHRWIWDVLQFSPWSESSKHWKIL